MFFDKIFLKLLLAMCFSYVPSQGATIGLISDFNSGTTEGWSRPVSNQNPAQTLTILPAGGSSPVLSVFSTGTTNTGGRLVVPNSLPDWQGDYTAAGVSALSVELTNNSSTQLHMRIAIQGASANRWVSTVPTILNPSDNGVFTFSFSDLSPAGSGTLEDALANVTQIRILHNPNGGDFRGAIVAASFTADNITLIPEPQVVTLASLFSLVFLFRRKKSTTPSL